MNEAKLFTETLDKNEFKKWKALPSQCSLTGTNCTENVLHFLKVISPALAKELNHQQRGQGRCKEEISEIIQGKVQQKIVPLVVDKQTASRVLQKNISNFKGTLIGFISKSQMSHLVVIAKVDNMEIIIDPQSSLMFSIQTRELFENYIQSGNFVDNQFLLFFENKKRMYSQIKPPKFKKTQTSMDMEVENSLPLTSASNSTSSKSQTKKKRKNDSSKIKNKT
jgi:hypothetical protein